mgnify:CR=1 FL=1
MKENYLMYGGDYNPEQWLSMPEVLETDLKRFREARINTVSLGIFSWARLEPREGEFCFEWMENVIDRLWENEISVILATPSGARPHWMADRYPEVLRVDEMRRKALFGGRHNHCLTSPVYREKVRLVNTELAKRLGSHPAVKMWHISNEYGGECHCGLCQEAFRQWLKRKYGTIEALNDAWCTAFWSHIYDGFEQIEGPSPLGEGSIMGLTLDWRRFVSDQTIDFMEQEIDALRQAGAKQPVTTNLMYHFGGIDYFSLAQRVDVVSWDNYPTWHKKQEWETARDTAFWHDVIRSLKRKPFLMLESCPGATNWQGVSKLKRPGMVAAACLQSIAHGADAAMYFQMRKSRGGEEKFHGAVLDHYDGNDTRTFRDVCETGEMLELLGELAGTGTRGQAAVVYDWENRWALEGAKGPRNDGLHYEESVEKSYRALRRLGLNVDIVDQRGLLSDYPFVAAPMQYLFRPGFEEKVREYVKGGGCFVMTYWSGVVDENDRCFLGGTPYGLTDVFGLRSEEIDALYDWEENTIHPAKGGAVQEALSGMRESYTCKYLCQLVKPSTARTLMVYGKDFYAGMPALLKNDFGRGSACYVCADMEQAFYDDFYRALAVKAGIIQNQREQIPEGVEVTVRSGREADYVFLQNFGPEAVQVKLPEGEVLFGNAQGNMNHLESIVLKALRKPGK